MRYAKTFFASFALVFALGLTVDRSRPSAAMQEPSMSAIVYDDGTVVTVRRPGYPDVH
jgi:hypothetical protein